MLSAFQNHDKDLLQKHGISWSWTIWDHKLKLGRDIGYHGICMLIILKAHIGG
jgi:hypothetical protein